MICSCRVVEKAGNAPRRKDRPVNNLSNTRLTKANLDPKYHHLVHPSLQFRHLVEVIRWSRRSEAASFTAAVSANIKRAHLAYRLSTSSTPTTLAKIGAQDVSHLCGNAACFRRDHLVVESGKKNRSREECFEEERRRGGRASTSCSHKPACIFFPTRRQRTYILEFPLRSRRHRVAPVAAPIVAQPSLPRRSTHPEEKKHKFACTLASCRRKTFYLDIPPL